MPPVTVTVPFPVPAAVAYDYLLEPANRPRWQRSLRGVEVPDGLREPGLAWRDVTRVPGLRLPLRLVEAERPHRWVEVARWRGFTGAPGTRLRADRRRLRRHGDLHARRLGPRSAAHPAGRARGGRRPASRGGAGRLTPVPNRTQVPRARNLRDVRNQPPCPPSYADAATPVDPP